MRLFDLRAAACALGAMERPPGDRICIWSRDAAPEVFQGLKVENREPSWVVYIPPRLLASAIAHSLRDRENNGVAVYRIAFGGLVYLGEGRCIEAETPGVKPGRCRAVSPNFPDFSREWMLHALLTCQRATRELSECVLNGITSALKVSPRQQLADFGHAAADAGRRQWLRLRGSA